MSTAVAAGRRLPDRLVADAGRRSGAGRAGTNLRPHQIVRFESSGADVRAARPAAFAGFVFVPGSPRRVTAAGSGAAGRNGAKVGHANGRRIPRCAVGDGVRRSRADRPARGATAWAEDAEYVRTLRRELPGECEIWTAAQRRARCAAGPRRRSNAVRQRRRRQRTVFDWVADRRPSANCRSAVVAGGIGPRNARAARAARGLCDRRRLGGRRSPGRKSPEKIAALFDALRPTVATGLAACA